MAYFSMETVRKNRSGHAACEPRVELTPFHSRFLLCIHSWECLLTAVQLANELRDSALTTAHPTTSTSELLEYQQLFASGAVCTLGKPFLRTVNVMSR